MCFEALKFFASTFHWTIVETLNVVLLHSVLFQRDADIMYSMRKNKTKKKLTDNVVVAFHKTQQAVYRMKIALASWDDSLSSVLIISEYLHI